MRADEATQSHEECFKDQVRRLGNLVQAGESIGHSPTYYSGQMTPGGSGLNVKEPLRSLELMGDPLPTEIFHTAMNRLGTDPALILKAAREHQAMASDLYFRDALPRLEALIAAGPTAEGDWSSRAAKIEKLDKLRRRDRQLAKVKLQELISNALDRLEATGLRPRQAFVELSSALGVLAALQRLAGRRDDAMDLLLTARPLSLLANDLVAEGEWFMKAAFLLVDLNRNTRAYQFLLEAQSLFFLGGAPARQAATAVVRGYVLTHAGLHADSRKILEPVLSLLPVEDVEGRLSAHQTLAKNLRELGDLRGASKHLSAAIELIGTDLLARATCLWTHAELLTRLDENQRALEAFQEALPLFAKLTGAAELAEMAMQYANLLVREGRRPELRALAADLSMWIQQLRGNRKLRDVIDDFTGLIELNSVNEAVLVDIEKRIQEVKLPSFRRIQP